MGNEIFSEPPITFNEAARFLPENLRPAYSTWWRWWRKGVKGQRLRTIVIGGRRYTTKSFVEDFVAKVTAAANGEELPVRTPRQRQRAIERAEAEVLGEQVRQQDQVDTEASRNARQ